MAKSEVTEEEKACLAYRKGGDVSGLITILKSCDIHKRATFRLIASILEELVKSGHLKTKHINQGFFAEKVKNGRKRNPDPKELEAITLMQAGVAIKHGERLKIIRSYVKDQLGFHPTSGEFKSKVKTLQNKVSESIRGRREYGHLFKDTSVYVGDDED